MFLLGFEGALGGFLCAFVDCVGVNVQVEVVVSVALDRTSKYVWQMESGFICTM